MTGPFDVIIVGGGVIGASCAYHLSRRRDLRVALVDDKRPGNASRASAGGLWAIGESVGLGCGVIFFRTRARQLAGTAGTAASAAKVTSTDAAVLVDASTPHILPASFFEFALASNTLFPGLHAELRDRHGMDIRLERSGLKYILFDDEDRRYAEHIAARIPHLADHMRWLDANQLRTEDPAVSHAAHGALEFIHDHQVNPYRLTDAFTEGARQNGVHLFTGTTITSVHRNGPRVTGVRTADGYDLHCGTLINAAGAWAGAPSAWATGTAIPVTPVKGQIVLSERLPRLLHGCLTTSDCYVLQKDNGEVLIGSTTEHKGFDTSISTPEIASLVRGAVRCVPALADADIKRCWAGLRPGSPDELPILGPVEGVEGYLNACGHFRTGILTSAITGVMIDALVRGTPLPVDITPFLASRFKTNAAGI